MSEAEAKAGSHVCCSTSAHNDLWPLWTSGISDRGRRRPRREQVTDSRLFFLACSIFFNSLNHHISPYLVFIVSSYTKLVVFDFSGWRMSHPLVMRTTDRPIRRQDPASQSTSWVLATSVIRRLFGSLQSNWYVFLQLVLLTLVGIKTCRQVSLWQLWSSVVTSYCTHGSLG